MVEQRPFKPLVGGSSPPAPTTIFPSKTHFFPYLKNQNLTFFACFNWKSPRVMDSLTLPTAVNYSGRKQFTSVSQFELAYRSIFRNF